MKSAEQTAVPDAVQGLRVLVVDDHRAFAQALGAGLLNLQRFGSVDVAFSAGHALALVDSRELDVILLDRFLGDVSGIDVLRKIKSRRPDMVVAVVSGLCDVEEIICALREGARAWIPKDVSLDGFLEALEDALAGGVWLPRGMLQPVLQELLERPATRAQRPPSFVDDLTPRQLEVLDCLASGMSRAAIAEHLVLSPHTVRTHVQEVLRKAGVRSTLAALALARAAGHSPSAGFRAAGAFASHSDGARGA